MIPKRHDSTWFRRLWKKYTPLVGLWYQGIQQFLSFLEGKSLGPQQGIGHGAKWSAWLGPGIRQSPSDDEDINSTQVTGNGSLVYDWKITDITTFKQTASISYADADTITQANSSVTTRLYKDFGLEFKFSLVNHSKPPEDSENTNTITTINVVYSF